MLDATLMTAQKDLQHVVAVSVRFGSDCSGPNTGLHNWGCSCSSLEDPTPVQNGFGREDRIDFFCKNKHSICLLTHAFVISSVLSLRRNCIASQLAMPPGIKVFSCSHMAPQIEVAPFIRI
jgi:hypothetical protein